MKHGFLILIGLLVHGSPSHAARMDVDLELVLAVDVSGSVDGQEAALQRNGYISAFQHPSVIDAIKHGPRGKIAVTYIEWGAYGNIHHVIDWTLIRDKATSEAFAQKLRRSARLIASRTSISGAIDTAAALLASNDFKGKRQVIDVSGDGANNSGDLVTWARDRAIAMGISINGLPILNNRQSPMGNRQIASLDLYYRDCVIGGPRAFYIVAKDFKDFGRAVLRKLILEIADRTPDALPETRTARRWPGLPPNPLLIRVAASRKAPPCHAGEQRLRKRRTGDDGGWMPQFPFQ
ncbi:MAG: DUF1194 domain-containing protein [Rhodospirillaceae bacterium]|jgi:hypothetical protein|nr:DUF1194 domain-containing protein [Rhodospirillaceae bacterium]MBT5456980.1 DUF1194 domain-containing protein [Rhodospirillaceae bacterium]